MAEMKGILGRKIGMTQVFDEDGRVWFTARVRNAANPAFCRQGSDHPSAQLTALDQSSRQLSVHDPETKQSTMADTCFSTGTCGFPSWSTLAPRTRDV